MFRNIFHGAILKGCECKIGLCYLSIVWLKCVTERQCNCKLSYLWHYTDVGERLDSSSGCFTRYLFDRSLSGSDIRSGRSLTLPHLHTTERSACRLWWYSETTGIRIQQTKAGKWETRWHNWLKHCATSRKVAGSIPDGATTNSHLRNTSGRTMTLGLTQLLTEKGTTNISCSLALPLYWPRVKRPLGESHTCGKWENNTIYRILV